jgi:membrane protein YdbS with pleckstrin-like domain
MKLSFIIRKFVEHSDWLDIIQTVSYPVIAALLAACTAFFAVVFSFWWFIATGILMAFVLIGLFMINRTKRNSMGIYHIDFLEDCLRMKKNNRLLRKKVRGLEFKLYQKVI